MRADSIEPVLSRVNRAAALDRVLALDASDRRLVHSLALAVALLAHGTMAGAIRWQGDSAQTDVPPPLGAQELAIERELPPPPPPPEPDEPPTPPPEPPKWAPPVIAPTPTPSDNPYDEPASEAARAGEVLVQTDDDDKPDDPDETTFVTGDGGTYAGGVTTSGGTSTAAVRGSVVADGGVAGGVGLAWSPPQRPMRDRSRGAWLAGNTSWDDCDFPGEADRDQIRDAVVGMTVTVRPNGTAQAVDIIEDPGHGFARTATACALKHRFAPALDRDGHRILGTTRPFHIGFHR